MSVKSAITNRKGPGFRYLCFILAGALIGLAIHSIEVRNEGLLQKQTHLAMRALGDEWLSASDDHESPVPPIEQVDDVTLRLSLPIPIEIDPDLLVELSLKHFHADVSMHSIASVREATSGEVVYSFEIDHLQSKSIPCLGRKLPVASYLLDVSFYDQGTFPIYDNVPALGIAGVSILFLFVGFSFRKEKVELADRSEVQDVHLDLSQNRLLAKDQMIQLTQKETELLAILFENAGELVTREYLEEEVWLKNGVVTGRSLDMYISRLRKKTSVLPNVQIVNQHGKGYILKIK